MALCPIRSPEMGNLALRLCVAMVLLLGGSRVARAISPGQIDTFEGGTNQSWASGGDTFDSPLPTGGPAGASDHFISVNSGTSAENSLGHL